MQNGVPSPSATLPVEHAVAARTLSGRADTYADEVRRLVDAAYTVMRRADTIDPRVSDIVTEADLSNQAFYRHFRGKDELLLAVLEDGQRRLIETLRTRMARCSDPEGRVRAWIEGVLAQARNADAAANTRPFVVHAARLGDRFPRETARSRDALLALLRAPVAALGGDSERDADAIYQLAMGRVHDALVQRARPGAADVEHTVGFAMGGIRARA